jgi:hypothetical protein
MSDLEFVDLVKQSLDDLLEALTKEDWGETREICSRIGSEWEIILSQIRGDAESKIRREIEQRPHDPEEYDTSEDEQSKSHEDEEEVLERVEVETDEAVAERFPPDFPDLIDEISRVPTQLPEESIKSVGALKSKYFP